MKKFGADIHAILGIGGTAVSFTVQHYNAFMGGIAATATAAYMIFRAMREFSKWRREESRDNSENEI